MEVTPASFHESCQQPPTFAAHASEQHWYAAYTCANHEKRVALQLEQRSVEHFLPLYEEEHRWKDRRIKLRLPLFPGYVFVRLALVHRLRVLQIPSLVRLVGFNGQPCALPEEEMDALRVCLMRNTPLTPHNNVSIGQRARVKSGPLEGLQGLVIRRKGSLRFVISLALIGRAASVEIDAADLEPASR